MPAYTTAAIIPGAIRLQDTNAAHVYYLSTQVRALDFGHGLRFQQEIDTLRYPHLPPEITTRSPETTGYDADWYLVNEGALFTKQAIEACKFSRFDFRPNGLPDTLVLGAAAPYEPYSIEFYMGVASISSNGPPGEPEIFGWAKFRITQMGVSLIEGAVSYEDPDGIRVGSYEPISAEPTSTSDFNNDGAIDAADYTVWRDGLGLELNPQDYQAWRDNYGASVDVAAGPVPTPTASALATLACVGALGPRRR